MNFSKLKQRCLAKESDFHSLGKIVETSYGPLVYIDNGSPVLAIAHLDFVTRGDPWSVIKGRPVTSRLDDRLGVHIILDMLPELGITPDILLSTGEESMMSTATWFETEKQYNWMFQFDRAGTDVVMYQYDTDEKAKMLEDMGFHVGRGIFTDMCTMDHLGMAGFNFGTGYYQPHSKECYAEPKDVQEMVNRFARFYHLLKDTKFPYELPMTDWRDEKKSWWTGDLHCDMCGQRKSELLPVQDCWICDECCQIYDVAECEVCGVMDWKDSLVGGLCEYCQQIEETLEAEWHQL